ATKGIERRAAHALEPSIEPVEQPRGEVAQPTGLEPVGTRRADGLVQCRVRRPGEGVRCEQSPRAQRRHRARRLTPRGVLRENGAGCDLERATPRPPALRPESAQEVSIDSQQPGPYEIARRPRNAAPGRERGTG